jgi:hypothetical protein
MHHRTCTVGCSVRRHVTQPLGFGSSRSLVSLSSCGTGQSGAPLTSALTSGAHCSRTVHGSKSTVVRVSFCSAGAPDSPVNYSGARIEKPESGWFELYGPGAPDTVRCVVPQPTLVSFAPLYLIPNLNIYWFVLNLYAPVEHIF